MAWKVTSLDSPEPSSIVCAGGEKAYSYQKKKKNDWASQVVENNLTFSKNHNHGSNHLQFLSNITYGRYESHHQSLALIKTD
jgi:hypothetical protein